MNPETNPSTTKLCPTCGTRLSENATRCLVCGAELSGPDPETQSAKIVQGSRMPSVVLSLPAAIGLLALFLGIGAVLVYFALSSTPEVIIPETPTTTITLTTTPTQTTTQPPPTLTSTPEPSPTPITYLVQSGDNCISIAAFFGVSVQSIVTLNNLPAACDNLTINQPLLIPQPTPTATPQPSATLSLAEQTEAACEKVIYIVQDNDTLGSIATNYQVPMEAIRVENGLTGDTVYVGDTLIIPLCRRFATPGPTPTPTSPPPYPAANLLLPADGAPFTLVNDTITLQWAAVGTLRENEAYAVSIEDVTLGSGERLVEYVSDTKYTVPTTLRPTDNFAHVFRWWIFVVRQTGTDNDGNPIWDQAGTLSVQRVFTWVGTGIAPTNAP
jgi:LysM repeat protein